MLRAYAEKYVAAYAGLDSVMAKVAIRGTENLGFAVGESLLEDQELEQEIRDALSRFGVICASLPIPPMFDAKIHRTINKVRLDSRENAMVCLHLVGELELDFLTLLESHLFLQVRPEHHRFYAPEAPHFGDKVGILFPDASRDIDAAGRCFALDEWTACVFHLMRVLEHGLRALAARVGLPSEAMVLENWKTVIDQIEKKIREMEVLPKSQAKSDDLKFYSAAAAQFRWIKDAWRNHVSHSRDTYDERQAEMLWNSVREFMQQLAARV